MINKIEVGSLVWVPLGRHGKIAAVVEFDIGTLISTPSVELIFSDGSSTRWYNFHSIYEADHARKLMDSGNVCCEASYGW